MEVVMTTDAIRYAKLGSKHYHQQTNTQLLTGWTSFLSPNQQCQSTGENNLTLTSHQSYFHQNIISLKDFVMHKIFILLSGVVSDHRQENGSFRSHTLERG